MFGCRAAGLVLGFCALTAYAAPSEYVVKTAFLYNFFKFIDWPGALPGQNPGSYLLCYAGKAEPYAEALAALEGREVAGRTLSVRREVRGDALKSCHMLFLSEADGIDVLREIANVPVVTVSDSAGFIQHGGMIGLLRNDKRIGFEVNLEAANASNIHFSSQMLKLARSVKGGK